MFLPLIGFTQKLPHWETSCYIYSKENLGYDCFNVMSSIFEKPDGSIVCQPYQKPILKIGNIQADEKTLIKHLTSDQLNGYFHRKDLDWYCSSKGFIALRKGKLIHHFTKICTPMESIAGYQWINNTLYFIKYRPSFRNSALNKFYLYSFDGRRFKLLKNNVDGMLMVKQQNKMYLIFKTNKVLTVSLVKSNSINPLNSVKFHGTLDALITFKSPFLFSIWNHYGYIYQIKGNEINTKADNGFKMNGFLNGCIFENLPLYRIIHPLNGNAINQTSSGSNIGSVLYSKFSNSIYAGTETDLLRLFPHIRCYPRNYYNNNSNSTFTLTQDFKGNIWTGSYQGGLTVSDGNKILFTKNLPYKWLAQGLRLDKYMMIPTETDKGVLLFNTNGSFKKIADSVSTFCMYKSRSNRLFMGTAFQGLWHIAVEDLLHNSKDWKKITQKQGVKQNSIIAIAEDRFGNIWTGNGGSIAVYQPKTGNCKTWFKDDKKNAHFGARSILTDSDKNIWFGCINGGLYYYNAKSANDLSPENLSAISHPLLNNGEPITFLHQWKEHLLIGAKDKILLFDLKNWKTNHKVSIQYLNPMELNLIGQTEQNTCFTDLRDRVFWFSSSENIYRIDLKKWFQIPKFKIEPNISVSLDSIHEYNKSTSTTLYLKARQNSFQIEIQYQSKDNMPRYLNGILTKEDEQPKFSVPNLQHQFNFANLESGSYIFHVRICQQDGSYTLHQFPITITPFLWETWWFWLILSLIPISFITYIFRKRSQLKEREKQVAQLSLATLSNQFRPHYMLNALNGISAQLDGKPKAEALITHLGESIDLLFQSAKSNHFTHSFANEWQLVQHIIEIQRLLYISNLKLTIVGIDCIPDDLQLPTGLLQIPVENALLHGLRHKVWGEKQLVITAEKHSNDYFIWIADNGVGRAKASEINDFNQHGSGLTNIHKMVQIINQLHPNSLDFEIIDLEEGTKAVIRLRK